MFMKATIFGLDPMVLPIRKLNQRTSVISMAEPRKARPTKPVPVTKFSPDVDELCVALPHKSGSALRHFSRWQNDIVSLKFFSNRKVASFTIITQLNCLEPRNATSWHVTHISNSDVPDHFVSFELSKRWVESVRLNTQIGPI
jgi:hypothetical protein